jgi:hypothetical protein
VPINLGLGTRLQNGFVLKKTSFSFGIITKCTDFALISPILESILNQSNIEIDILIVGGEFNQSDLPVGVRHIPFDENQNPGWITRKKNLVAINAKYENLVICHDYLLFMPGWSEGFLEFGFEWNIAMTRVSDIKGRRFYDWVSWDHPSLPRYSAVDYADSSASEYLFIPGAYWIVKKSFMLENPLNENLVWGESEDVEWSIRVRNFGYRMNPHSEVRHIKKHRGFKWWKPIY